MMKFDTAIIKCRKNITDLADFDIFVDAIETSPIQQSLQEHYRLGEIAKEHLREERFKSY